MTGTMQARDKTALVKNILRKEMGCTMIELREERSGNVFGTKGWEKLGTGATVFEVAFMIDYLENCSPIARSFTW